VRGLSGDVDPAELGAAVWREGLWALVDEERPRGVRRDDAQAAQGAGDESDEPARGEHPRRCSRHVRFDVL